MWVEETREMNEETREMKIMWLEESREMKIMWLEDTGEKKKCVFLITQVTWLL